MKSRCILAGIDFGVDTEKIVSYAAYFSTGTKSSVRLLYVMDYLLTPPTYLMPYIEEEKKRDEGELQRWRSVLEKQGISSDARILMGRLHESFMKAIEEFSPDLLIIGYQSHAFRLSSSERLIKSIEMPMLVVRGPKAERPGSLAIKKILCAVDFSDNAQKALASASDYARTFSADLHIIHSIPSHTIKSRWAIWEAMGKVDKDQFDMQMQAEAEAELSRMIKKSGIQQRCSTVIRQKLSLLELKRADMILLLWEPAGSPIFRDYSSAAQQNQSSDPLPVRFLLSTDVDFASLPYFRPCPDPDRC